MLIFHLSTVLHDSCEIVINWRVFVSADRPILKLLISLR